MGNLFKGSAIGSRLLGVFILLSCALNPCSTKAAGVTIITHGFGGNVDGWITGMANEITNYPNFPGTNSTTYTITLTTDGTSIYYQWSRVAGSTPTNTFSGEIIVKLDWSQMAGSADPFSSVYDISTYDVAVAASYVFMQTNAISDLDGHALVEYPIHMIGHSRGGSLVTEISRILGTNGLWVDHLTTLDPHPLNNDGNNDFPFLATDASAANTYQNVLFHDNYWQDVGIYPIDPHGEQVNGAYNRYLPNLSGGYQNTSPNHSNVHLWYHGTLDFDNPASDGDPSNPYITITERYDWWNSYEDEGVNAGFLYSLIGRGDRTSSTEPEGDGHAIRDGYNQDWDLGAGQSPFGNRTGLTSDNGNWPNVMKFDLVGTNQVQQGTNALFSLYYQWAQPATSVATIKLYLDDDFNPYNSNSHLVKQLNISGTGTSGTSISFWNNSNPLTVELDATNAPAGYHVLYAQITGGGRTRYLYAPELIQIISDQQQPVLDIHKLNNAKFIIGINGVSGQKIALQTSSDLENWVPLATNTLTASRWTYTNSLPASQQFYRAILNP